MEGLNNNIDYYINPAQFEMNIALVRCRSAIVAMVDSRRHHSRRHLTGDALGRLSVHLSSEGPSSETQLWWLLAVLCWTRLSSLSAALSPSQSPHPADLRVALACLY